MPTEVAMHTFTPSATATFPTNTPSMTFTPSLTPTETLTPTPLPTDTPLPTPLPSMFELLVRDIDTARFMNVIARLENFKTRHANSMQGTGVMGIDAARDYLLSEMQAIAGTCAAPARVDGDPFPLTVYEESTLQLNIVGVVPGTGPNTGAIVVGAHYDTIYGVDREHYTDEDGALYEAPGANDNGSGVTATMELMRAICKEPRQKTFVFVLFAAEEVGEGRNGSRHFIREYAPSYGIQVEAMLNLDTIGSATDENGALQENLARLYSAEPNSCCSRQLARTIQAMSYVQMPEFILNVEDRIDRANRWGDHMSFEDAGVPAVRLFEGSEDIVRQDTPRDILNDVDPPYLRKNIQVALAFLLGMSEGLPSPRNIDIRGATVVWEPVPGAERYLVAYRTPNSPGYIQFEIVEGFAATLPPDTIFAIGSIGSNGLLGSLSEEAYIESPD